jgi:hypothetical protein
MEGSAIRRASKESITHVCGNCAGNGSAVGLKDEERER